MNNLAVVTSGMDQTMALMEHLDAVGYEGVNGSRAGIALWITRYNHTTVWCMLGPWVGAGRKYFITSTAPDRANGSNTVGYEYFVQNILAYNSY